MLTALTVGFLLGFVGSIPVAGPIAALVFARGAEGRFLSGVRIAVGGACGEALYVLAVFYGFSEYLTRYDWILPVSRAAGGTETLGVAQSPRVSQGTTRYVDDDGTCPGTPCYATIQGAVDTASDGDEIRVEPGVYGNVTVSAKEDLEITGVHPDAVFIDGGGGDFAVKIQDADSIRLENLTLRNADEALFLDAQGGGQHLSHPLAGQR